MGHSSYCAVVAYTRTWMGKGDHIPTQNKTFLELMTKLRNSHGKYGMETAYPESGKEPPVLSSSISLLQLLFDGLLRVFALRRLFEGFG